MVHQLRHRVNLRRAAHRGQRVGHLVPRIAGAAEVGRQPAVVLVAVRRLVAVASVARCRVVPVLHNLRRCRGYAASHHPLAVCVVVGALVVVQRTLVPRRRQQGTDGGGQRWLRCHSAQQLLPLLGHRSLCPLTILLFDALTLWLTHRLFDRLDACLIVLQPPPHVGRHRVGTESARKRIAQYRPHAVVCCHQYEAPVRCVEDIEPGELCPHQLVCSHRVVTHSRQVGHTHLAGVVYVDRFGPSAPHQGADQCKKDNGFLHKLLCFCYFCH